MTKQRQEPPRTGHWGTPMTDLRPVYQYPRPLVGVTRPPDTNRTCPTCHRTHRDTDPADCPSPDTGQRKGNAP